MSGRRTPTWGDIEALCDAHDIEIIPGKGGEKKLKGMGPDGKVYVMRVQHKCCTRKSDDFWIDYTKKFQRTFGISDTELFGA